MSIDLFVHSLLLGFAIAAPVGPIGILCIQRTLHSGFRHGLVSGLGAATADALYGFIAALGLSVLAQWLTARSGPLTLAGGLLLCYLGIQALRSAPNLDHSHGAPQSLLRAYSSIVLLTLTNPMTILSFAVLFGGLQSDVLPSFGRLVMPLGVFTGSALWWLALSGGVALLRRRLAPPHLRWLNRLAGLLLIGFGLVLLSSLLKG